MQKQSKNWPGVQYPLNMIGNKFWVIWFYQIVYNYMKIRKIKSPNLSYETKLNWTSNKIMGGVVKNVVYHEFEFVICLTL